jgi:hypothetical protein
MRVYPTLFRRLKCWDDESLKCPWLTHPLSELYDSTSAGAGYAINLYDLSVYAVQNARTASPTATSGKLSARCSISSPTI